MKMNRIDVWLGVTLCLFLFGCSQDFKEHYVLLEIGDFELTVDEFQNLMKSPAYSNLSHSELQAKLIADGLMLADAIDSRYDTIDLIEKKLEYAARYYASRVDGYVWNKKVKPNLTVTEEALEEAYSRRNIEIGLDVIQFASEEQLYKYCEMNSPPESKSDFYAIKAKVSSRPEIKSYNSFTKFPYLPLGVNMEEINQGKIGTVVGPMHTLKGYVLMCITGKRRVLQTTFEKESPIIKRELYNSLVQKFIWESQQRIFTHTNPQMHARAINEMAIKYEPGKKQWPGIDTGMVLMNYFFNEKKYSYTVADFMEFVRCQPVFFGSLSDPDDIRNMMKSFLIDKYLFTEAQKMNIEKDEEYLLFRKRYKHQILLQYYKQKYIFSKLEIRTEEIEDYYRKNSKDLKSFESASLYVYEFHDRIQAINSRELIVNQLKGLSSAKDREAEEMPQRKKMDISLNDTLHTPAFIAQIRKLNSGQLSLPIEVDGRYWVVCIISKAGSITLPYRFAAGDIEQMLLSKREKEIQKLIEQRLTAMYPLKANHIKEYLDKAKN